MSCMKAAFKVTKDHGFTTRITRENSLVSPMHSECLNCLNIMDESGTLNSFGPNPVRAAERQNQAKTIPIQPADPMVDFRSKAYPIAVKERQLSPSHQDSAGGLIFQLNC
jgi:hypothetical protein